MLHFTCKYIVFLLLVHSLIGEQQVIKVTVVGKVYSCRTDETTAI